MKQMTILLVLLLLLRSGCDPYIPTATQNLPSATATVPNTPAVTTKPTQATAPSTVPAQPQPHVHSYVWETVAATCTESGYTVHTCTCGDRFTDETTAALGHAWDAWQTVEPATVEKEGLQRRECTRCDAFETRTMQKLEPEHTHVYSDTVAEPTCTAGGYTDHVCVCGDSYRDTEVAPLGHSWGDWVTTKAPTTEAEGTQTRTCTRCGAADNRPIEKLPQQHTHAYKKTRVAATCTEGGYTLYACECGDSYREETSQPKGHSWGGWTVGTAPTVTQTGQMVCTCEACGDVMYRATEKLPSADGFIFVILPDTVGRNEKATVAIIGKAGVTYDIDVYYKSGESSAKGLEDQTADANGFVSWTWKIGPSTAAGTYRIEVTGNGVSQTVYFTVVV